MMKISTQGIARLTGEPVPNVVNRRSAGILSIGTKQGRGYVFSLREAVQMRIARKLVGFLTVKHAYAIAQDETLAAALDAVGESRADAAVLNIAKTESNMDDEHPAVHVVYWLDLGEHGRWAGQLLQTEDRIIDAALSRLAWGATDEQLPADHMTFNLVKFWHQTAAAVDQLPKIYGAE